MPTSDPTDIRASAVVLFLDLQDEIIKNSRTNPAATVRARAGALAKLAALHRLPVFASSVAVGGAYIPEVLDAISGLQPRPRTATSAFADPGLVAALGESGRQVLILAGVASEIVVQRTALAALTAGYVVQVAVDATGGISERTEDAAWRRIVAGGAATTSVTTLAADLAGDFTTELGGATLGIMYETLGG